MVTLAELERLYGLYNKAHYIDPDPLMFLHRYPAVEDREIAGLIAATLAFGRVKQICASVERALAIMSPSPRAFLEASAPARVDRAFAGFRHRYVTGGHLAALLTGIRGLLAVHGSLDKAFAAGLKAGDATVLPALTLFTERLNCPGNPLVSSPAKGSACKRLHLYLRWMVRHDDVDPGGWTHVSPRQLVIPLDTHMARLSRQLRFTRRRSPGAAMALDVTAWFRRRLPDDPVKFDFTLTRFGIRSELRHILPGRPVRPRED
jgi:uncharacterized protein (TIGR02757 family)